MVFDISGGRLHLASAQDVPTTPVLALVPTETDFDKVLAGPQADECQVFGCGGGGGGGQNYCTGIDPNEDKINICQIDIASVGDYEGWLMGSPEVSIRLALLHTDVGTWQGYAPDACVNEDASAPRYLNMDNDYWAGTVFLVSDSLLKASVSATRKPQITVWEDDNGSKCEMGLTTANGTIFQYTAGSGFLSAVRGIYGQNAGYFMAAGLTVMAVAIAYISGNDELIGQVASLPADSLSTSKTIYRAVSETDSTQVARGEIKFATAQ